MPQSLQIFGVACVSIGRFEAQTDEGIRDTSHGRANDNALLRTTSYQYGSNTLHRFGRRQRRTSKLQYFHSVYFIAIAAPQALPGANRWNSYARKAL
jgi:hypothetical protein